MTGARFEWVSGGAAGAIVGLALGHSLTGLSSTAETGQVLWAVAIVVAATVTPRASASVIWTLVGGLPFMAILTGFIVASGEARAAMAVARGLAFNHLALPLSAYTQRDLAIRYGVFFLFVLVATLPAFLMMKLLGRFALSILPPGRTPAGQRRLQSIRTAVMLLWRMAVVIGAVALTTYI